MVYLFMVFRSHIATMNTENIFKSKKIKRLAAFTVIGILLVFSVSFIGFGKVASQGYQYEDVQVKQNELAYLEETYDVLLFGDSIAWAGYDPGIFWKTNGIPAYNCATSGQWLGDGRIILNTALEKLHPEVIVWDANSIYTRISRVKYYLSQYIPVFHYHFAYLYQNQPGEKDSLRGFNSDTVTNPYTGNPDYMTDLAVQPYKDLAAENLEEIYNICKEHNIILIMTCLPNASAWNMGRHKAVQEWCESHGVEFIDYNLLTDEIGIDWSTDTRDGGEHLNNSGANKVCRHLSDYLKDHYDLQNHGKDPACSEWIEDYGEVES